MKIGPSQLFGVLEALDRSGRSPFIWGPPGIGKSEIVRQYATRNGYDFVDVRLSMIDPTSLMGVPVPVNDKGGDVLKLRWSKPWFLDHNPNKKTVLFLDEFNSAPPSVMAAAYQLILDKRVGEHVLNPDRVFIVAAGNGAGDRGVTYVMPKPLSNRLVHIYLEANAQDFLNYAVENNFNRNIVSFLTFKKDRIFSFDPKLATEAFPTPRSWKFASDILNSIGDDVSNDLLAPLIAGCVGETAQAELFQYMKVASKLPDTTRILLDNKACEKKFTGDDLGLKYALIVSLCYSLRDILGESSRYSKEEKATANENFMRYLLNNIPEKEMIVFAGKMVLGQMKLKIDVKSKSWQEFVRNFSKYVL